MRFEAPGYLMLASTRNPERLGGISRANVTRTQAQRQEGEMTDSPGNLFLDRLTAGHPLAVKALRDLRWAQAELVEVVRIVRPRDGAEDAIDRAMIVSAIRLLIEASPSEYLELMREAAKQGK